MPFLGFNEQISVLVGELVDIVLLNDDVRNVIEVDAHVLKYFHGCFKLKILDICSHERRTRHGDGDIKVFCCCSGDRGWRYNVLGIIYEVYSNSNAHTENIVPLWPVSDN